VERNPGPRSPAKSPKKELGLAQVGTSHKIILRKNDK
jgi:hypothetical protein